MFDTGLISSDKANCWLKTACWSKNKGLSNVFFMFHYLSPLRFRNLLVAVIVAICRNSPQVAANCPFSFELPHDLKKSRSDPSSLSSANPYIFRGFFLAIHQTEISRNWILDARRRLAMRRREKPVTKAGQIRALWPEIDAVLAGGQSMNTIREWLQEDAGITLSITSLTSYVSRIRRRELLHSAASSQKFVQTQRDAETRTPQRMLDPSDPVPHDPLAPAMEILRQRRFDIREVHGDGDPTDKNLI